MWNKRPSQLLLVRISFKGRQGRRSKLVPISVSLAALDVLLGAIGDLGLLADLFAPLWQPRLKRHLAAAGSLETLWNACREVTRELRKFGRWRMLEVEADDVRIYVDFY